MKIIKLDYGEVEIGKIAIKTIEIWNESYKEQVYQVQRDPITNPLDHVFHLRSYTWTLASDEKYICEIRYQPLVAFSKNVDYFVIIDTSMECTKIITYGCSIGPEVTCSTTKIFMNCTIQKPEVKRRIRLTNNSKVAATFMFNIDEKCKPFQIDAKYGIINPCSRKYITITFTSTREGRYTYYLVALILYQEPIIIELYGWCSALSFKADSDAITYPLKSKGGFKGYMRDGTDTLGDIPPISLSKQYFNLGQTDVDVKNLIQTIPHSICLTNHNHSNLLITWEKDTDEIFNIIPSEMLVCAHQSALFELTFNPNTKNNLYGKKIICSVLLEHKKHSTFPFVTSVTVIGHSFPVISNGWIPQYEIPQTVIMPPCMPSYPVYTTFLIKRFGHLPLMFQFVSPSASHFLVKPMLGVIYQDYEIIVVEMTPKPQDEQIYIERWTVYFNGNTKNEYYIDFKGYAENANIVFGNNNVLSFPPVMLGCQQFLQLAMRNVTRHTIKYQFYQLPPELNIQYISGEIDANDTLHQECSLSPNEPNIDYDFEVQCILNIVKKGVPIGSKYCVILCVRGSSEIGSLKATPNELYFKELEYNNTKTLHFDLINSSLVDIYYKLICTHRNWPLGNIEEDVKLHPASETIFSGSHKKITVSITPHTAVYYEFAIRYLIRVNFRSDALIARQKPVWICNVYCMCILPTLKVQNICAFGYNQHCTIHISKQFLWKRLHVNRLNKILENILPKERKSINIDLFPMFQCNKGVILIEWIMINPSSFPITFALKRIKNCSCKPVIKTFGYLLQHTETDCIHTNLCTLNIRSKTLCPKEETVIGMTIHYTLIGKTAICWELDIGHDRYVMLNVVINCLAESQSQDNFLSTAYVNFGRTYFGNKGIMYRVNWIYNITNNDLPYSIDINNICKVNKDYHYEVFSCLTQCGVIKIGTAIPLLLKFQPRMFGTYKVIVPITMGDKTEELTIEGESTFDFRLASYPRAIPSYCTCKTSLFPAYFSIDCIDVWFLPMHNVIVRMLLVYNNLDFDALAYEWICQDISEILYIDVFPRKGILHPKAVQSFRIKIYTKGYPCRIDVHIPCIFFNASKRRIYQRSIIKHAILSQELAGQFTITEKGTYVPKPWIKILNKPDVYYKTLSLRCSVCTIEDESTKVSLLNELKASPANVIYFDDSKKCNVIDEKELCIVKFILEGLLWDIVNSKRFKKIVEDSLIPNRNLYYTQFMMDISERKRLIRRSYISPPLTFIDSLLEQMLFSIIHDEFSLKTAHLIPNEDVRHRNYLKMLPKQKRTDLENELEEDRHDVSNEEDNNNADSQYLRTGFRVSFM
ncbi:cilia- and flagella-associated protein 65 [Bombus fervidus]|uniref:cilia- and flagella-associated protein 65 n=1 Tax=Bombus fervidus TaxID=203811 RepID=UPI003AB8C927